jgi:hypothetical protein
MASAVRLAGEAACRQDHVMKRMGRSIGLVVGIALLFSACSRQPGLVSPAENPPSKLPFDNSPLGAGISPTKAFASISIPSGTAIEIQLQSSLSSRESHPGDEFQAVLSGPIVVQGQTLAESGAAITGKVLAAKACRPGEPGYLRLTLSSVVLNGKAEDVHSSSLFCKGGARDRFSSEAAAGTNDVHFSTGRRLTFRLIQPVPVHG